MRRVAICRLAIRQLGICPVAIVQAAVVRVAVRRVYIEPIKSAPGGNIISSSKLHYTYTCVCILPDGKPRGECSTLPAKVRPEEPHSFVGSNAHSKILSL
jgi:hypothetical protein